MLMRWWLCALLALALGPVACPSQADPLAEAIVAGDLARVQALVAADPGLLAVRDADGWTPLYRAVSMPYTPEKLAIAAYLCAQGADPNVVEAHGIPLLVWLALVPDVTAAEAACVVQRVQLLLTHGADPRRATPQQRTPLHVAAYTKKRDFAELLLAHGAVVDARDEGQVTPLHEAATVFVNFNQRGLQLVKTGLPLVQLLVARGASVTARDALGRTPVLCACSDLPTVQYLVAHGADLHDVDRAQATAVHYATTHAVLNEGAVLRYLLEQGLSATAVTDTKQTPLFMAATLNCGGGGPQLNPAYALLRAHGARLTDTDVYGNTLLHLAAPLPAFAAQAAVQYLLAQGVPREARNNLGHTAASLAGDPVMQQLLRPDPAPPPEPPPVEE